MDILLMSFVLISLGFLFIIISQYKKIQLLEEQNRKLRIDVNKEELTASAKEKLKTVGNIKAVKYVRKETGMSLLEAKRFVDQLEENR